MKNADGARRAVLIADASADARERLSGALAPDFAVFTADDARQALVTLRSHAEVCLLVADAGLLDDGDFSALKAMRLDKHLRELPVIALSDDVNVENRLIARSDDALDVVRLPICALALRKQAANLLARMQAERLSVRNRHMEWELHEAQTDPVTGLCNKDAFLHLVQRYLSANPKRPLVLLRWDVDSFRVFNDIYGTAAGDEYLHFIGSFFTEHLSQSPWVLYMARYEGDHFVGLVDGDTFNPNVALKNLNDALSQFVRYPFDFTPRVGLYRVTDPTVNPATMCGRANLALQSIKNEYGRYYAWYDDGMRANMIREHEVVNQMKSALADGQFHLYYQPQYDYVNGKLIGAEALVRWIHPEKGIIPPGEFIPIFERNGFIYELDRFVWEEVCSQIRQWKDSGAPMPPVTISVNIPRKDLFHPEIVQEISGLTEKYRIQNSELCLEITESAYMDNPAQLIEVVNQFRAKGFSVEMDDFGSGYSSLNALKNVPVDLLKLDMKFLADEGPDESKGGRILSSVIRMAHNIDLPIIAEGVETQQQADYLKSMGCRYMQGYFFARPMPLEEFRRLLTQATVATLDNPDPIIGVDGAADFMDADTQTTLLFNSFVSGAAILEYHADIVAAIRLNDRFFEILNIDRDLYAKYQYDLLPRFVPESRKTFVDALRKAARTGKESGCEVCSLPLTPGGSNFWSRCRFRCLTKRRGSTLFYMSLENITEEKRLLERNEMYRNITLNLPVGTAVYELGDKVVPIFVNDQVCEMFGFTPAEYDARIARGESINYLPPPEAYPADLYERLMKGEKVSIPCLEAAKKDGSRLWMRTVMHLVRPEGKKPQLHVAMVDITRQILDGYETSAVSESIPGGVFRCSGDGERVTYVSPPLLEMLGFTREQYNKKFHGSFPETIWLADRKRVCEAVRGTINEQGGCDRLEYRFITADGRPKWFHTAGRRVAGNNGEAQFVVVAVDIDQRMQLEDELRVSELEYRMAAQQSDLHVYRYDSRGRTARMKDGIPGGRAGEAVVPDLPRASVESGAILPESREDWLGLFDAIDKGQPAGEAEVHCDFPGVGVRWFRMQFTALDGCESPSAIVTYTDVTDERENRKIRAFERDGLLTALSGVYPLILACNLTQNATYMLQSEHFIIPPPPQVESYDGLMQSGLHTLLPEDRDAFAYFISREHLKEAFAAGERILRHEHRQHDAEGDLHWMETIVVRTENPYDDDVLTLTVSRPIDAQKENERKLRQTLDLTAAQLERQLDFDRLVDRFAACLISVRYDGADERAMTVGRLGRMMGYTDEEAAALFDHDPAGLFAEEDLARLRETVTAIRAGTLDGYAQEYCVRQKDGKQRWITGRGSRFVKADGSGGYTHIFYDTTRTHDLTERLERDKRVLTCVSSQSDRVFFYFDSGGKGIIGLDPEKCDAYGLSRRYDDFCAGGDTPGKLYEDSVETMKEFRRLTASGQPSSDLKIHLCDRNGEDRWFELRSLPVTDPVSGLQQGAVISMFDVTERHEQELVYAKYQQTLDVQPDVKSMFFETDLTADRIERAGGDLYPALEVCIGTPHDEVVKMMARRGIDSEGDRDRLLAACSRSALLEAFEQGRTELEYELPISNHARSGVHWLHLSVQMVRDTYSDHVRLFTQIRDITGKKEQQLDVQRQADTDGMTGLFNRAAAQRLAEEQMGQNGKPGSFLLLDIDDFKLINDRYGHLQGDRALIGVAKVLKKHFRSTDVIARVGGDEFAVLMPGMTDEAILAPSLRALLYELTEVRVGPGNDQAVHCSIGCAPCGGEDCFAAAYEQADIALYHVKRNFKNDYSFYTPQMREDDYVFTHHMRFTLRDEITANPGEIARLMDAIASYYPLVVSVNLTQNSYTLMESGHGIADRITTQGSWDGFLQRAPAWIHPDDWHFVAETMTREALLAAYAAGKANSHCRARQCLIGADEPAETAGAETAKSYCPMAATAVFYRNTAGDVCDFLFVRPTGDLPA